MATGKGANNSKCGCNASKEMMATAFSKSMVRKDMISPPKQYEKEDNPEEFLRTVENYAKSIGASEEDMIYILVNNLAEDIKYQLFALPEYSTKSQSYSWIKEKFLDINRDNVSSPLLQLLRLKQKNYSIKDYVGQVKIRAYKLMGQENSENRASMIET